MEFIKLIKQNNQCAFCSESLTSTEPGTVDTKNEKVGLEFSLQEICHYFKENLHREILILVVAGDSNLKLTMKTEEGCGETKGYSVWLCQRCVIVAQQLTSLCRELELIQMKVDYSVKQFMDSVTTAAPSINHQEYNDTWQSSGRVSLVKSRQLRVALSRCDPMLDSRTTVIQEHFEDSFEFPLSVENALCSPPLSPEAASEADIDINDASFDQENGQMANKSSQILCGLCSLSFPSQKEVKMHIVNRHPQHFFSTAKLDVVTVKKFNGLCARLLHEHWQHAKPNTNGARGCLYCKATFKIKTDQRLHLVKFHNDILREKITQLQLGSMEVTKNIVMDAPQLSSHTTKVLEIEEDDDDNGQYAVHPTVESLLQTIKKWISLNDYDQDTLTCGLCPEATPSKLFHDHTAQEKHIFEIHPDYFLQSFKKSVVSKDCFRDLSSQAIQHFQSSRQLQDGSGKHLQSCTICSCTFLDKGFLVRHQIQAHFTFLCQKVLELQDQIGSDLNRPTMGRARLLKSSQCPKCGMKFNSHFGLAGHLSRRHRGTSPPARNSNEKKGSHRKERRTKCHRCGETFVNTAVLKRHQVNHCNATSPSFKCKLCDDRFTHRYKLNRHVYYHHSGSPRHRIPIACQYCGLAVSRRNLARHIKNYCHLAKQQQQAKKQFKRSITTTRKGKTSSNSKKSEANHFIKIDVDVSDEVVSHGVEVTEENYFYDE